MHPTKKGGSEVNPQSVPPRPSSSSGDAIGTMPQPRPKELEERQKRWGTVPRAASPIREDQLTGGNKGQSKGQKGKGKGKVRARSQTGGVSCTSAPAAASSGYGRPAAPARGYGRPSTPSRGNDRAQSADRDRGKRPRVQEEVAAAIPTQVFVAFKSPDPDYPVNISVV